MTIAIEHGHRNSGFTHEWHGDFPVRYVNVYRRVSKHCDVKLGIVLKIHLSKYLWDFLWIFTIIKYCCKAKYTRQLG